jgi:hypothetical protein
MTKQNSLYEYFSPRQIIIKSEKITKKRKSKTKSNERQLFIDAGQKDFKYINCKKCGMMYMYKLQTDTDIHNKFCKNSNLVEYKGYKNEKVIKEYDEDKVIMISKNTENKKIVDKAKEIKKIVDKELGFDIKNENEKDYTVI